MRNELFNCILMMYFYILKFWLLNRMYPAMETLIEPHRLIACMICVVSIVRPMLTSPKYYPEGPSHVLPLLKLSLPGIDPNDFKKTLVSWVDCLFNLLCLTLVRICAALGHYYHCDQNLYSETIGCSCSPLISFTFLCVFLFHVI